MRGFGSAILAFVLLYAAYSYYRATTRVLIPEIPATWWGPGSRETANNAIRPFKISFSDKDIEDLKHRLKNTRKFPASLEKSGWVYGVDGGNFLPTIIQYWLNDYNFKERETYLNRYPQFITNIQGLDIHYVHVKPKNVSPKKRVIPLLIQHGWPGSTVEFHKILPMLTTPREEYDFVFEVIAPSLPGFGFSSAAIIPGLGSPQIAVVLKNLMLRIGFEEFYTQGGDWGAIITANMAALFPQHVLGMHSTMCSSLSMKNIIKTILYAMAPSLLLPKENQHMMYPLKEHLVRWMEGTGYMHIQATKPDTVGVGSSDSPAALAAYVLEKFSSATNPSYISRRDGGLFEKFTAVELIDNLMMYWIPNSMTTSMRIYAESLNRANYTRVVESIPITVPSACAQFPNEIIYQPAALLMDRFQNLLRAKIMPRGGHFAALEEPELLANDVWEVVAAMQEMKKTVKIPDESSNEL